MNRVYTIKDDHPVIDFIRLEIEGYLNKPVCISKPSIDNEPVCGSDIYGLQFNSNNRLVPTINVNVFYQEKSDNSPKILKSDESGYEYYKYSTSVSIKLKTFIERNPQFNNIDDWADIVKPKRESFRYHGHNSINKRFTAAINSVNYSISFPKDKESDSDILDWSKPACEALTRMYWRDKALDIAFNIKRNRTVWVDGIWFRYDYKDGLVEIYDMVRHQVSIHDALKLFKPKDETIEKIKVEIESGDLEVKEIVFIENRFEKTSFDYEELVPN
jgi:hypothetical protein